jgi:tetratricopeptide (TPR) repeat protein
MAWGWLARSLAFGNQDEALEALAIAERIVEIAPEHPCVWTWEMFHGVACMNLGRYPEALAMFRKVVEAAPKFVRGLMALANALGALDQPEEAAKLVARVATINSNFTPQRFADYSRTMSASEESTARLMAGLRRAGLLD